jgi:amino-acid N-acetyltransferase
MVAAPIERAATHDTAGVLALLTQNKLPLDGVLEHLGTTLVSRKDGRVVGCAALEVYTDGALLRSVAVAPELQRQGLGQALTGAALQLARDFELPAVYLLTTTAEQFFPKFGFERVERPDVPASVQSSIEFRSACPSSASVMRKVL